MRECNSWSGNLAEDERSALLIEQIPLLNRERQIAAATAVRLKQALMLLEAVGDEPHAEIEALEGKLQAASAALQSLLPAGHVAKHAHSAGVITAQENRENVRIYLQPLASENELDTVLQAAQGVDIFSGIILTTGRNKPSADA